MIYEIDPLEDSRWPELVERHPCASVFHTRGWLEAIQRTYGYPAAALTTSSPGRDLANGLLFCRVRSWLTGRRLVSLPFSDHCEPLGDSPPQLAELFSGLEERVRAEEQRYSQIRPVSVPVGQQGRWRTSQRFYLHRLDLRPGVDTVFRNFHEGCIKRRIRHAENCGVTIREGRDTDILATFYRLVVETRKRQGVPPQPFNWFRNLIASLGTAATIYCAYKDGAPAAAILTLRFRGVFYYKYGASIARLHPLGAMPHLLWRAIQDATRYGCREFDMGRSDVHNRGLVTFKDRWNASRVELGYVSYPSEGSRLHETSVTPPRFLLRALQYMPKLCLTILGKFAYRHID